MATYVSGAPRKPLQTNAPTQVSVTAFARHALRRAQSAFSRTRGGHAAAHRAVARVRGESSPQADPLLPYTLLGLDTPLTMTLGFENTRLWKTQGNLRRGSA
jgi:hypothetical protein